jgi:hypothetical protein
VDGLIANKVFRYKFRQAAVEPEDYLRKEKRMISRMGDFNGLIDLYLESKNCTSEDKLAKEQAYYDALINFQV